MLAGFVPTRGLATAQSWMVMSSPQHTRRQFQGVGFPSALVVFL